MIKRRKSTLNIPVLNKASMFPMMFYVSGSLFAVVYIPHNIDKTSARVKIQAMLDRNNNSHKFEIGKGK